MGALVHIYKSPFGDTTNNGVSSGVKMLTVMNVDGPFKPNETAPPVLLVKRETVGNIVIVPCDNQGNKLSSVGRSMFGGNFAYGDSNFAHAVKKMSGYEFNFPVAIHDRYEG